uniref:Uncharacterized protein n=1 Tax=Rhizophagus irregularis (strain DAOM 181602 / DAOM 197198 / MUCL 43194) TaxID=747089 RepID=U9UV65_RHIID
MHVINKCIRKVPDNQFDKPKFFSMRVIQTKSYNTTLLTTGKIIPEIHYGHFSREWWIATENNINDQATLQSLLVPIRLAIIKLDNIICSYRVVQTSAINEKYQSVRISMILKD